MCSQRTFFLLFCFTVNAFFYFPNLHSVWWHNVYCWHSFSACCELGWVDFFRYSCIPESFLCHIDSRVQHFNPPIAKFQAAVFSTTCYSSLQLSYCSISYREVWSFSSLCIPFIISSRSCSGTILSFWNVTFFYRSSVTSESYRMFVSGKGCIKSIVDVSTKLYFFVIHW